MGVGRRDVRAAGARAPPAPAPAPPPPPPSGAHGLSRAVLTGHVTQCRRPAGKRKRPGRWRRRRAGGAVAAGGPPDLGRLGGHPRAGPSSCCLCALLPGRSLGAGARGRLGGARRGGAGDGGTGARGREAPPPGLSPRRWRWGAAAARPAVPTALSVRTVGAREEGAASSRRTAHPRTPTAAAARRPGGPGREELDAALRSGLAPDMGAGPLVLLAALALLPRPGDGNEGSVTGSCYCDKAISSGSPPTAELMAHLRKHLRVYQRCNSYVRFQLRMRSVCGGSKDPWVQQLMSCLDLKECGSADSRSLAPQEQLPPLSTQVPEPTERAPLDMGSPAQTYLPPAWRSTYLPTALQSTRQPALPAGTLSLDKKLTHTSEIATSTVGYSLGTGSEAGESQKQQIKRVEPTAGTSAMVPVLSLLGIIFILTGVLLYVLCKRREQSLQHPPDLQLHYTPVASDSNV
ncbi:C-X-C motif chemokine 16 [Vulpes vulpes]|uniref:C-X-C motif chemokine 16 n=1 Tax=Vulpes vulpes TaxID=9627 RepID=A0A3Q7SVY5_VULVU